MTCSVHYHIKYDPETGRFGWLAFGPNDGRKARGWFDGSLDPSGYLAIRVRGQKYWAHRLAWRLMTGAWPVGIDHINGDRTDNRWINLREASKTENARNKATHRNNALAVKGVHRINRPGLQRPYIAQIMAGGVRHHLGFYSTAEAAAEAYAEAAKRLHGDFARLA